MRKKKSKIFILGFLTLSLILVMILLNFLGSKKQSIELGGSTREYLLHLSRSHDSSENLPLVIALHGYTDNPRLMEFYSGLSRKSDREGFVVVYPYGTKNDTDKNLSWNGGSCCGNGVLSNVEDVQFINSLTDELIEKYKIDPERIYIAGFSNGGLLAHRIASETPERYKAIAVVSGAIGGKVYKKLPPYIIPNPKKPVSMLLMHGMKDSRIPYKGGLNNSKDGEFKSFKESSELWIQNNNCKGSLKTENKVSINESFENCENETRVELYSVKESGHMWFGGIGELFKNLKGESISATSIIWSFFKTAK